MREMNYTKLTPTQLNVLQEIYGDIQRERTDNDTLKTVHPDNGGCWLIRSPTGSGKTLSYLLPLLLRLRPSSSLQAVVIVPTPPLAVQVTWSLRSLSKGRGYTVMKCTGGKGE
ncbi:hypothetical protein TrRE_jg639, partial [Triparma retinervis]